MVNLTHSQVDKDYLHEFIFCFARFEYALKRAKYLKDTSIAKPNWKKFRKELAGKFQVGKNPDLEWAINFITKRPPDKQIVKENKLDWETITRNPKDSQEEWLLQAVETVRNNLFHGGKFPGKPVKDVSRDSGLLKAGIIILKEALRYNDFVRHFFKEEIP